MERHARFGKKALVERVPDQRMLNQIVVRLALAADQIKRLHRREPRIDVVNVIHRGGQQLRIETPPDHRGRLQERRMPHLLGSSTFEVA
jgi:hypothetical protein